MSAPDHEEIHRVEKRFKLAARKMHELEGEMGMALTILEYDSDRRKALVARYAVKHIKHGESASAADTLARADPLYEAEFKTMAEVYEQAQLTKKMYENEEKSWETARSLLARQRETLRTLPEN